MGLRNRLLALVLLAAVPALLLVLYNNLEQRRLGAARVHNDAAKLAQLIATKQAGLVDATRQQIGGLARLPQARATNTLGYSAFFANLIRMWPDYTDFGLIETNGILTASSYGQTNSINLSDRPDFSRALHSGQFAIGEYRGSTNLGKPSVLFGHPVLNTNGAVTRVVYAALDLDALQRTLVDIPLPPDAAVRVLDKAGHILASAPVEEKLTGQPFSTSSLWSTIAHRSEGTTQVTDSDRVTRLYAFTALGKSAAGSLFVAVGIPAAQAFAETNRALFVQLSLLAFVAVTTSLAAWIYANRFILRPISALAKTTSEVTAGNLSARTGVTPGSSELSVLAADFDRMAASLQQQRTENELAKEALLRSEQRYRDLSAELEDRVKARTAELESAYKELEAFSYSVSHDLRAPLRPIHGYVEMLELEAGPELNEEARRLLRGISSAAKRMGTLIDSLLAFSRMSRSELRRSLVPMDVVIQECIHELESETQGRAVDWKIAPLPEVWCDRTMLKQVWANLLSNAVKYTRIRDRAQIEITGRSTPGEFLFAVRDNGVGFDMKYVHKLFGVFQRLHQTDEFEGTGIGLANVHRIITRHGGRVWAEGESNGGAQFSFTLPARAPETDLAPG